MCDKSSFQTSFVSDIFNVATISRYLNIDSSTVEEWMNAQEAIPEHVVVALTKLDTILFQGCENAVSTVRQQFPIASSEVTIPITTYLEEDDFLTYCEEATIFRTVRVYQGFVMQVIARLKEVGYHAYPVPFDCNSYRH